MGGIFSCRLVVSDTDTTTAAHVVCSRTAGQIRHMTYEQMNAEEMNERR